MPLYFFNSIKIGPPYQNIYKRLGFRKGKTKLSLKQKKEIGACIEEAFFLVEPKAVALRLSVQQRSANKVSFENGISFRSQLLFSLLEGCGEALFMGVTSGKRIANEIRALEKRDMERAIIYDAVASEVSDSIFDWLMGYFAQELRRQNKALLEKRISCGYGDFSLEYQKVLYEVLDLARLGLKLTKGFMLIPEKSATAVTGIKDAR